jgi:Mononegavirales RNA dependent RNA polymerase
MRMLYFTQPNAFGKISWTGQNGGIEGLNQYTWVGIYVGIALLVFESIRYPYSMMDNGDDLRVCIWVPKDVISTYPSKTHLAQWLKLQIADKMIEYGHVVKVSETYCSQILVAYSQLYIM